ncbi:hypothetical protein CaCOL14_012388 [Colletotrichum acutatum]|uniref:Uncharacterized protein n=1 Tax=Glomerella acutata TaxID=27357 RepID=A0AAD8U8T4_GLOAC|nr:uncharacterized protein BDZ83DRAFT_796525 [Colletotrichum acutatum]KAK1712980.1 hypothetical protein BDZ83DRAFT_796525 [Colletotrichum acutatum]
MPRQVIYKTTMGPARRTRAHSQALINSAGAAAAVSKITVTAMPNIKGSNTSTTEAQAKKVKKEEKAKQVAKGEKVQKPKPRFDTFHPFPRLPNEIKAMILCEYIDFEPAIIYASCKANKYVPGLIDVNTGKDGRHSKYKCLTELTKGIPDFKAYIERQIGVSFHDLSYRPQEGVRNGKDLIVLIFNENWSHHLNWYSASQRELNREKFVPGIENIGVMYDSSRLRSMNRVFRRSTRPCSIIDLGMMIMNLRDIKNFYILVKLRGGSQPEQKKWMKKRLRIAKRPNKDLVVFEDKQRTWVEITRSTARHQGDGSLLRDVANFLRLTERFYHSACTIHNGPPNVRFRILVASHFLNKTLGI